MIYDVIVLVVVIGLVLLNFWRGAARALAGIATSIIAYFGATALGSFLSEKLYFWLLKPAIDKAVSDALSNISNEAAGNVVNALPSWLTGLLDISGENLTNLFSEPLSAANDSITKAVDAAVQPIAIAIISFFMTILLFLLFSFIIRKLLMKPLLKLFDFPVIRTVNKFLGIVVGLVDAFLVISMLAYLLHLIIPYVGQESGFLSESTIYNSFIFYHFYNGNIFSAIGSSIIGLPKQ